MRISDAYVERLLLENGICSQEQLDAIQELSLDTKKPLQDLVVEHGWLSEVELARLYADEIGVPFIELPPAGVPSRVLNQLPATTARRHRAIIFAFDGPTALIAMEDPTNNDATTLLKKHFSQVKPHLVTSRQLQTVLDSYDDTNSLSMSSLKRPVTINQDRVNLAPSITESLNRVVQQAVRLGSNDIHIEPYSDHIRIRWRSGGKLHDGYKLPLSTLPALLAYVKNLGNLPIHEHDAPQYARWQLTDQDRRYEVKATILPTASGEKVVLHIIPIAASAPNLRELGLWGSTLRTLTQTLTYTNGALFISGPRHAGKATTLFCLAQTIAPHGKTITIEESPDYLMKAAHQVIMSSPSRKTFTQSLRAIVDQDPHLIMVNISNDHIVGPPVINTAASGHFVISSFHAPSAAGTLRRLVDIGVEPFMIASNVRAVVSQRLVRTLCLNCREPFAPGQQQISQLKKFLDAQGIGWRQLHELEKTVVTEGVVATADSTSKGVSTRYLSSTSRTITRLWRAHPGGCEYCDDSGYSGQTGLFEVFKPEQVTSALTKNGSVSTLQREAIKNGMVSLYLDGLLRSLVGQTAFIDVLQVLTGYNL
jgi:type IV pilus assembly protein PilB